MNFDTVDIAFSNFTLTWSSSPSIDIGCWTEMRSTDCAPSFKLFTKVDIECFAG
jgi:REP-associated tyrosine transposase